MGRPTMPNLARGFRRLAWVGSVVLAAPWVAFVFADPNNAGLWYSIAAGAFGLPWALFFTALWIARGFSTDERSGAPATDPAPLEECSRCGSLNRRGAGSCECRLRLDR